MERKTFGKLADGEEATLYTISNTKGRRVAKRVWRRERDLTRWYRRHRLQILEHPLYHLW